MFLDARQSTSYEELIHPDDRAHVLATLDQATRTGQFNERFRIVCTHGEVRWVHVRGFPVRNAQGKIFRLVGTAQEITEQKRAEDQVIENLAVAEAARAEADALRKATLALTQDLRMDFVMEALLRSLEELIPYTCARVLVPEGGPHVLALGERQIPEPPQVLPKYHPGYPLTLIADESPFLKRVLEDRKSVLIPDTKQEKEWKSFKGHSQLRSWLSVPLLASDEYLGFLSIGHTDPNRYNQEHLRCAELLSIPAAAAIQNASPLCPGRYLRIRAGKTTSRPARSGNCAGRGAGGPPSLRGQIPESFSLQPNSLLHHNLERGTIRRRECGF